jgi:EAL domain-containing protein (putative c-di-GMP-specific phosphodiesterase class I)
MHLHVLAKRTMELELRSAPGNRELLLYYQPLVDLRTQVTSGYEALLRWNHPVRGLISADEFVEVAEDTGLINPIGAWVLKEACREAATWPAQMFVAVNLSAKQFKDPHIVDGLQRALAYSGLPANRLELEITETALLENSDNTTQVLQKIKDLGVAVAMDDFGTGYSSISYLQKVNFDKIKIDRSFITGLATSPRNLEIVRAILAIGKSLNIRILAEGIETESEYLTLRELGCHEGQGYYFGRPMSAKAMQSARKQRQVSNI